MKELFNFKYDDLFNPTLKALHNLGNSGSISEIENEVSLILSLSEEEINDIHRGNTTKLTYRLAWARNYLKRFGILENSSRGIWALTEKGRNVFEVDQEKVKKFVQKNQSIESKSNNKKNDFIETENFEEIDEITWQTKLIEVIQNISPLAFERLCQRLLRELGFQNVEITGKPSDGGIDGKGILKIGSILSFHVLFQAKRYKGAVSSSTIRDFRGAMMGRADKGLIITTGYFTREAKKEAQRDGATPLDLIDGNELAEKLKELDLGVDVELVEKIKINEEWFKKL